MIFQGLTEKFPTGNGPPNSGRAGPAATGTGSDYHSPNKCPPFLDSPASAVNDLALIDHMLQFHLNRLSSRGELAILQALGRCKDALSLRQHEVLAVVWSRIQSGVRT
jgi:hypothetical protein